MSNRNHQQTVRAIGMRTWPMLLLLAFLVAACIHNGSAPRDGLVSDGASAEYRTLYDSGFNRIIAALPSNAKDSDFWPLEALGRFRAQRVAWATLKGNRYYALESGYKNGGWLVMVPLDSEILKSLPATMQMDPNPGQAVILIRQEPVSQLWAGVFLVHEMSHLADRCVGAEPPTPTRREYLTGELRAYALELMAADVISVGTFRQRLDSLLDDWHVDSLQAATQRAVHVEPGDVTMLSAAIPGGEPQSAAEGRMRAGFCAAATVLRFGERNHLANDTVEEALGELLSSRPQARMSPDIDAPAG